MRTRAELTEYLEEGKYVTYRAWIFTKNGMNCWLENCCNENFSSVDEAVESILEYCSVEELSKEI